jgi:signal recognition particle receptor subunit alpha
VTISDKVDKKAMDSIDMSIEKGDGTVNLEAEMEKYLGGDDEVLEGFFESDDELNFDSINPNSHASSQGLFTRFTSALQSMAGNKVLTKEDMEPILVNFAKQLMDKNVAQDVANDICRQVE